MSGVQYYQSITPSDYKNWNHPELTVGLVYAKKKKTRKRKVTADFDNKSKRKPFVKIEFDLINNISGDFVLDEARWFPKIDKVGEARERNLINKQKDFAFWDRRDLTVPGIYGYAGATSCGPMASDTLLPNQYYLQFKQKNRTVGFEIVSGPEDPLVKEFVKIQSGVIGTKVNREPTDYFKEMSGYAEVTVKSCPLADEFESGFGFHSGGWGQDTIPNSFHLIDSFKTKVDDLTLIDFYSYISRTNNYELECNTGDRFLVIERLSSRTSRGNGVFFHVNAPRHRYLKVENGQVDSKNILSMISIHSEKPIYSDHVKTWIREANTP